MPSLGHQPATVPNIPTTYTFAQAQAALQAVGLTATQANGTLDHGGGRRRDLDDAGQRGGGTLRLGRHRDRVHRPADDHGAQRDRRHGEPGDERARRRAGLVASGVSGNPQNNVVGTQPSIGSTVPTGSSVQLFTH